MAVKPKKKTEKEALAALDSGPYAEAVAQTTQAAIDALSIYGKPTMTLEELRTLLDKELPGVSLSELVIKMRQESW